MFKQMTTARAAFGTVLTATVLTVGAASPATAADDFGDHVSTCAQAIGFSGDHNPGMHQGRHGWDPTHAC